MRKHIFRKTLAAIASALALFYIALLLINSGENETMEARDLNTDRHRTVAVFGATGTVGDGLLLAVMNDPHVEKIHVVTRRPSPRIEAGVASGKAEMTIHEDYLDYAPIDNVLTEVDAVYWAIGLSAVGLDEETYREIHVDFPVNLVSRWLDASEKEELSFHYISGGGANAESRMMWARVKASAETELAGRAQGTNLRVVSYRPAFVTPTDAEINIGHKLLHAVFAPVNYAVRAELIGQAMLEVSARGEGLPSGTNLENRDIASLGRAYEERNGTR